MAKVPRGSFGAPSSQDKEAQGFPVGQPPSFKGLHEDLIGAIGKGLSQAVGGFKLKSLEGSVSGWNHGALPNSAPGRREHGHNDLVGGGAQPEAQAEDSAADGIRGHGQAEDAEDAGCGGGCDR